MLAKTQQLPRLVSQQREEMGASEREKKEAKKRCREIRAKGIMVRRRGTVLQSLYCEWNVGLEAVGLRISRIFGFCGRSGKWMMCRILEKCN